MKKDRVVSLRLSEEEFSYLAQWSKNSGKSMSELVRSLVHNNRELDKILPFPQIMTSTSGSAEITWEVNSDG